MRRSILAAAQAEYPPATREELGRIAAPVLVVSGELDPVLGRGEKLAEAIPRGTYLQVAGADHFGLGRNEQGQVETTRFLSQGIAET